MEISCKKCSAILDVDDSLQGQTIECPECGTSILMPSTNEHGSTKQTIAVASSASSETIVNQPDSLQTSSKPVPTHLGWSILVTILGGGFLFGFIAIVFSALASGANSKGDYLDAKAKAKTASIFAWIAFAIDFAGILLILLSIASCAVVSNNIGDQLGNDFGHSRISACRDSIATIKTACDAYEIMTGKYPDSIDAMLQPVGGRRAPLLDSNSKADPWGNPFQIHKRGYSVEIRSAGPDGVFNTEDDLTSGK